MNEILQPLLFPTQAGATDETFKFVVAEQFRNRARNALTSLADRALLDPQEVRRLAGILDEAAFEHADIWHFSAGMFDDRQVMQRSPVRCADQLMASLAAARIPLSYRFRSRGTTIYTAQGHIIDTDAIARIACTNGVIDYETSDRKSYAAADISNDGMPGIAVLPFIQVGRRRIDLITSDATDPFFAGSIEHDILDRDALGLQGFAACLSGIRRQAQQYYSWCRSAISSIIPLGPKVTDMVSGSQGACPGQIYVSGTLGDVKTAEMLIHEASHQYFRAIEAVVRLTRRGTDEEFYSPVAGRPRPLQKLLLGYHAFANVLLYMREIAPCVADQDRAFVANNIDSVSQDLATLAQGIDASTTLSEHGASIWHSMRTAILAG